MRRVGSVGAALSIAWLATGVLGCASSAAPAEATAPARGVVEPIPFRVTMLDVGTGLSILVTCDDFTLLYDAGSNDDRLAGSGDRAVAYLELLLGASGSASCQGSKTARDLQERPLSHVFLSHPHRDHVSFLPDVLACFDVANVWDSGAKADTESYDAFVAAVANEPRVVYHRAGPPTGSSQTFAEGADVPLGPHAKATILSVRPDAHDLNDASIVVRLDLGRVSMLLEGDATGGERRDPSSPPAASSVEAALLARHRRELRADILQVGHHGSMTSSRAAFLDAVSPKLALVSAGPMPYGHVVLPDDEVIRALTARGATVLRTDESDEACRSAESKVGPDRDGAPGGCSAVTIDIDRSGRLHVENGPAHD